MTPRPMEPVERLEKEIPALLKKIYPGDVPFVQEIMRGIGSGENPHLYVNMYNAIQSVKDTEDTSTVRGKAYGRVIELLGSAYFPDIPHPTLGRSWDDRMRGK